MSEGRAVKRGLLVTGTDTGVGKTLVTAGLCAWRCSQGLDVLPWKPVESGTEETGGVPADAELLARCGGLASWQEASEWVLSEPLAPVVAARRAATVLSSADLDAAWEARSRRARFHLVEGVGGALVEVCPGLMVAELPARWDLGALVIAGNRLGVLSHCLLTVESLLARDAEVEGVVLTTLNGGPPSVAERCNGDELSRLLPAGVPFLGTVGFLSESDRGRSEALAAAVVPVAEALWGRLRLRTPSAKELCVP